MDPIIEAAKATFPDSRSKEDRGQIATPYGLASKVYCADCGRFSGYVFGDVSLMFYLCNSCDKTGTGIDLPVIDPEVLKAFNGGG
jgi:hypothetical protein